MTSRLVLSPAARADMREAVHWYETQRSGLGRRFLSELNYLFDRIAENPRQFPEIAAPVRRALMGRFPYGIYFVASTNRIDVIAVLHLHRNPREWMPGYRGTNQGCNGSETRSARAHNGESEEIPFGQAQDMLRRASEGKQRWLTARLSDNIGPTNRTE